MELLTKEHIASLYEATAPVRRLLQEGDMPQDMLDTAAKCPWLQDPTPVVQQEDDDDIFGFDIAGPLSQSPVKEAPPVPSQAMEVDEDTSAASKD